MYFLICVFSLALVALETHTLICIYDLKFAHIHPSILCNKINLYICTHYIIQAIISLLCIAKFNFRLLLANSGLSAYHYVLFRSSNHLFDSTSVYKELKYRHRETILRIAFYIFLFAYSFFHFLI